MPGQHGCGAGPCTVSRSKTLRALQIHPALGGVLQSNYTDDRVTRMSDVPNIEVKVISTAYPPTGAGEGGVAQAAPAGGNGVAALTGVRLREMPFAPARVRRPLGTSPRWGWGWHAARFMPDSPSDTAKGPPRRGPFGFPAPLAQRRAEKIVHGLP
jgi:hypothetical protein